MTDKEYSKPDDEIMKDALLNDMKMQVKFTLNRLKDVYDTLEKLTD